MTQNHLSSELMSTFRLRDIRPHMVVAMLGAVVAYYAIFQSLYDMIAYGEVWPFENLGEIWQSIIRNLPPIFILFLLNYVVSFHLFPRVSRPAKFVVDGMASFGVLSLTNVLFMVTVSPRVILGGHRILQHFHLDGVGDGVVCLAFQTPDGNLTASYRSVPKVPLRRTAVAGQSTFSLQLAQSFILPRVYRQASGCRELYHRFGKDLSLHHRHASKGSRHARGGARLPRQLRTGVGDALPQPV